MFTPLPDETIAAQQRNWVTYGLASAGLPYEASEPRLSLLENRSVISGAGTTGIRTWEAALHLGSYLISSPEAAASIRGKRVLELGAGTGLLSMLCAGCLEADHVFSTDGDDRVVEALKENAALNNLSNISIGSLWWGRAVQGAWFWEETKAQGCDVVLGADLTYDKAIIPPLVATIRDLFEVWPAVQVIVSAPIRNIDTFAVFEHACNSNEFVVDEIAYPLTPMREQVSLFHSTDVPIRILSVTAPKRIIDPWAV
ncbi:hypothetical protein MBLNU459_g7740t1 [Dothideomycetes sp. NU459]